MSSTIVYLDICALKRPAKTGANPPRCILHSRRKQKLAGSCQLLKKARERRDAIQVEVVTPDQLTLDEENHE